MGAHVELAPNPKDIVSLTLLFGSIIPDASQIWANMTLSDGAISRKRLMGFLWMGLVGFFYTVPLALISFLANLAAVWSASLDVLPTRADARPSSRTKSRF
jgi:hypothetical protein